GPARVGEIVAPLEARPADATPGRLAMVDPEADHARRRHLHRGHAHLAVALGEVAVAGREEGALDGHGQEELGPAGELLHVEVAAVLAGRQGAEAVGGGRARGRGGVGGSGRRARGGRGGGATPRGAGAGPARRVHASSWACEGATPLTPMNGAPGMRTPGSWGDVAHPSARVQWTRNGVVIRSRRKPRPGMI